MGSGTYSGTYSRNAGTRCANPCRSSSGGGCCTTVRERTNILVEFKEPFDEIPTTNGQARVTVTGPNGEQKGKCPRVSFSSTGSDVTATRSSQIGAGPLTTCVRRNLPIGVRGISYDGQSDQIVFQVNSGFGSNSFVTV